MKQDGALGWVGEELALLEASSLLRTPHAEPLGPGTWVDAPEGRLLNLCSNDYLSLATQTSPNVTTGAGASRLVGGSNPAHRRLETALAEWLHRPSALLFSSGYAANVGVLQALAGPNTLVVSDALNHASIIDGCRLARSRVVVTPHLDLSAVEDALKAAPEKRRIVVTDTYFSMDGDIAELVGLRWLCDKYGAALFVDEAHALGVFGPAGRGTCAERGVEPDVLVGTLGKSFGVSGAFVSGSRQLIQWIWNRARSFVFSTGISPQTAEAAQAALPIIVNGERTQQLHNRVVLMRKRLGELGVPVAQRSVGPILPIPVGDPAHAADLSSRLRSRGIFLQCIRPPTVPTGTARLRLTIQAAHEPADLELAARTIASTLKERPLAETAAIL